MKNSNHEDTRTLEQILAGDPPPALPTIHEAPKRKRINGVTWFWLALGGIAWLSVMFGGPSEEEQAQERARQAQVAQAEQDQKAKVIAEALRQREARVDAAIAKREVFIGMTRDEVIVSWGRPQASNVTLTARGKHEQLVYESNYLYLTDDVLTSIQSMN